MYTKLAGLQYKFVYKPVISNQVGDAFSRHPKAPPHLQAISSITPSWLSEVIAGYYEDSEAVKLLQQLAVSSNP
jgi:hypothetical protein